MSVSPWTIEEDRRRIYDAISEKTEKSGINLALFYDNPSYFGKDSEGKSTAWTGTHPVLVHWPLGHYQGGKDLTVSVLDLQQSITEIIGARCIRWIKPENWHCTVFSPVHSGNPAVISAAETDISEFVSREVPILETYLLTMTRIIVTNDGGLLATGYASSHHLDTLRKRLKASFPAGSAPSTIHVTLGHFVLPIEQNLENRLNGFIRRFQDDTTVLGQLHIEFLTYAAYRAPFLEMRIEKLFKVRIGRE
jgi:hypothetical protein